MVFNIILYKCKSQLIKGLTEKPIDNYKKIISITRKPEFLHLKKEKQKGIIIYDGQERDNVKKFFNEINKRGNYSLLFLMPLKESKNFDFKKDIKNIFYLAEPHSFLELSYLIEMFFRVGMLNQQVNEYEKIIGAFEKVGEFSRTELMDAYENIKAHESLNELSRKELIHVKESLGAWEKVSEFSRQELIEKLKEKNALQNVQEFSDIERMFLGKILKAWEHTMELGRQELLKTYKELKICQVKVEDNK